MAKKKEESKSILMDLMNGVKLDMSDPKHPRLVRPWENVVNPPKHLNKIFRLFRNKQANQKGYRK